MTTEQRDRIATEVFLSLSEAVDDDEKGRMEEPEGACCVRHKGKGQNSPSLKAA